MDTISIPFIVKFALNKLSISVPGRGTNNKINKQSKRGESLQEE